MKVKVLILAMDTSTIGCSVALWRDGEIVARDGAEMARGQSEALVPMIQGVMSNAQTAFAEIDVLAVTIGPGAFTGLRIGLAAARGMALALGVPCLSVTTLEALAFSVDSRVRSKHSILAALDSKRTDIYVQVFDADLEPLTQASAVSLEALPELMPDGPIIIVGDVTTQIETALKGCGIEVIVAPGPGIPEATLIAEIAASRWEIGQEAASPEPLYLRPPDAKLPKNGGRLRA